MAQMQKRLKRETMSGESVTVGDVTVTPQSQAFTVRGSHGGWVWNRPVGVLVQRSEGEEERIPIVDVTRMAQLGLFGLSLVFALLGSVMWIMERNPSDE